MDQARFDELLARYEQMDEWQISHIQSQESDLTDEARAALTQVIASRSIDTQKLRDNSATEDKKRSDKQQALAEISRKREAKILKIFLIAAVPIIVVAAVLNPSKAYENLMASAVQAIGLALLALAIFKIKRYLTSSKRRQK